MLLGFGRECAAAVMQCGMGTCFEPNGPKVNTNKEVQMSGEEVVARDAAENPDARRVVLRSSGEVFEIGPDVAVQAVAAARAEVKAYVDEAQAALREIDAELLERMDRSSAWTLSTGGAKFSAPSPAAHTDLNGQALYEALGTLVEDGVLDPARRDEAAYVEVKLRLPRGAWEALQGWPPLADGRVKVAGEVAWAASKSVADAIAKSGDRARALVDSARIPKSTPRRITAKEAK